MRIIFDSLINSLNALWSKPFRSFLSMLGIIIGILTINALLTIALSVKEEITGSIEGLGANIVFAVPGTINADTGPDLASQLGTSTLTQADYELIKEKAPEAKNITMVMLMGGAVQRGEARSESPLIFAASPGLEQVMSLEIAVGRSTSHEDYDNNSRVAVIGAGVKENLFREEDPIGQTIVINGEDFEVVGALAEKSVGLSFGGPDLNQLIVVPITTGWEISDTKHIFRIMMQASDAEGVGALKDKVHDILLASHNGEEDFSVVTQDDMLNIIGSILDILTVLLTSLAGISLIVGGVGIMNIMLVSVSERTREVGIRRAVGATRFHIMLQFLIESVLLTILGGVIALTLFIIMVNLLNPHLPLTLIIDTNIVILSILFAIIIGVVSGVVPAWKASRQNTVDALRYE